MPNIGAIAKQFFDACETGKGWDGCKAYCTPDATFAAQVEPLADVKTLEAYTDWMKGLLTVLPDGSYAVKSFAVDAERRNVCAFGVFSGTHTGAGGPTRRPEKSQRRLRLRRGLRRRENPPHDQDLEFRLDAETAWLGIAC